MFLKVNCSFSNHLINSTKSSTLCFFPTVGHLISISLNSLPSRKTIPSGEHPNLGLVFETTRLHYTTSTDINSLLENTVRAPSSWGSSLIGQIALQD